MRRRPSDSAGMRSARIPCQIARANSTAKSASAVAWTQPGTITGRSKSAATTKSPSTPSADANSGQQRSQNTAARAKPTRAERLLAEGGLRAGGGGGGAGGRIWGKQQALSPGEKPHRHGRAAGQPDRAQLA